MVTVMISFVLTWWIINEFEKVESQTPTVVKFPRHILIRMNGLITSCWTICTTRDKRSLITQSHIVHQSRGGKMLPTHNGTMKSGDRNKFKEDGAKLRLRMWRASELLFYKLAEIISLKCCMTESFFTIPPCRQSKWIHRCGHTHSTFRQHRSVTFPLVPPVCISLWRVVVGRYGDKISWGLT